MLLDFHSLTLAFCLMTTLSLSSLTLRNQFSTWKGTFHDRTKQRALTVKFLSLIALLEAFQDLLHADSTHLSIKSHTLLELKKFTLCSLRFSLWILFPFSLFQFHKSSLVELDFLHSIFACLLFQSSISLLSLSVLSLAAQLLLFASILLMTKVLVFDFQGMTFPSQVLNFPEWVSVLIQSRNESHFLVQRF